MELQMLTKEVTADISKLVNQVMDERIEAKEWFKVSNLDQYKKWIKKAESTAMILLEKYDINVIF